MKLNSGSNFGIKFYLGDKINLVSIRGLIRGLIRVSIRGLIRGAICPISPATLASIYAK